MLLMDSHEHPGAGRNGFGDADATGAAVRAVYESLSWQQRERVCFDWNYHDSRGLLRAYVNNYWDITPFSIVSEFYTAEQRDLILEVFKSIFHPDWHRRLFKQLKDDSFSRPWGADLSIGIFGQPDSATGFQLVMTGRHLTCRANGKAAGPRAFGGPIFHGHAATGFWEQPHHPGNIFWHQAVLASQVFAMLDGKQRRMALIDRCPEQREIAFRGPRGVRPGIPVSELSADQKNALEAVLLSLVEPYRPHDRLMVQRCLQKQGGLPNCNLAFYRAAQLGDDQTWEHWRLEGPSFVWYFRGQPHVHIWINIAEDAAAQNEAA